MSSLTTAWRRVKSKESSYREICTREMDKIVKKAEDAEKYVLKAINEAWAVCHFTHLPQWLQDNDFLHKGHRPQLGSFKECFASIFRLHTETGNIWTHLLGCLFFLFLAFYMLIFAPQTFQAMDKFVFGIFFAGAIVCLGMSFAYHTVSCHSPKVCQLFSRLDYCGIALLIVGSKIPWLYYGFYCEYIPKVTYLIIVSLLGICTIIVSLWEKFGSPEYRAVRAGVFIAFGLSGIFPGVHWIISQDWFTVYDLRLSLICLISMGVLYILGALLYACRIPERYFPGKCDIWFQSHQLFHILVIIAAVVHYHGISAMAQHRLREDVCEVNASNFNSISSQQQPVINLVDVHQSFIQ